MTRGITAHRLSLTPLPGGGWRLCDAGAPDDDPAHLLAYIEDLEVGVDVVWLYGAFGHNRYDSLEDVLRVARGLLTSLDDQLLHGRTAIPHLPPPLVAGAA